MRRLSLRRGNSKRQRQPPVTKTTTTWPRQARETVISESASYDSFSGSTEFSGEDVSPNNNLSQERGDEPRSSYYQTPASAQHSSISHDNSYGSQGIVDYYNESWNQSSTFTPTKHGQHGHSTYQQSSGINYYSNPRSNTVSTLLVVFKLVLLSITPSSHNAGTKLGQHEIIALCNCSFDMIIISFLINRVG